MNGVEAEVRLSCLPSSWLIPICAVHDYAEGPRASRQRYMAPDPVTRSLAITLGTDIDAHACRALSWRNILFGTQWACSFLRKPPRSAVSCIVH